MGSFFTFGRKMIREDFIIEKNGNKPIALDVRYTVPDAEDLVIFCHGFKGFKDWGTFDLIANEFAQRGISFLKFNFAYNGTTIENPTEFDDMEAFSQNTFSQELEDLDQIVQWVKSDECIVSPQKIHLIGHSRGGSIAILYTSEYPLHSLTTWAAVSDLGKKWTEDFLSEAKKNDGVVIMNGRTGQRMPMKYSFFEDYFQNFSRLSVPLRALEISIPSLIIHGTSDEAVPYQDAVDLHKWITGSQILPIEGGDHVFGGQHPWMKPTLPADLQKVVEATIGFVKGV